MCPALTVVVTTAFVEKNPSKLKKREETVDAGLGMEETLTLDPAVPEQAPHPEIIHFRIDLNLHPVPNPNLSLPQVRC